MEKVLLFRTGDKETVVIADMLAAMKVRCERIPESAFHQTIGALAAGKTALVKSGALVEKTAQAKPVRSDAAAGHPAQGQSLMLFCDVSEKHFNRALSFMRSRAVKVDYKAVLTPINQGWNVLRLYAELAREKAEYEQMKG
ncbi:MAG: DUF3783 domain-containing protein [bacterium]|nr:DUF3783 domain-containing protein [bacterium]